ncbi:hypothetical protein EV2_019726 [Malus domestica]
MTTKRTNFGPPEGMVKEDNNEENEASNKFQRSCLRQACSADVARVESESPDSIGGKAVGSNLLKERLVVHECNH